MNDSVFNLGRDPFESPVKKIYKELVLELPYETSRQNVRVHPPVEVPVTRREKDAVWVCRQPRGTGPWKRLQIKGSTSGYYGDAYPDTFVAWDEIEDEWALHQVGDYSVTEKQPDRPSVMPRIIRGESETISYKKSKRRRRTFVEWWSSLGRGNEDPDFLRKKRDA